MAAGNEQQKTNELPNTDNEDGDAADLRFPIGEIYV